MLILCKLFPFRFNLFVITSFIPCFLWEMYFTCLREKCQIVKQDNHNYSCPFACWVEEKWEWKPQNHFSMYCRLFLTQTKALIQLIYCVPERWKFYELSNCRQIKQNLIFQIFSSAFTRWSIYLQHNKWSM